ncbi:hypothetical protein [Nocardioides sp. AE5]|uniref:hypothetical protein n=1 Tax=Nocardioides sp. AE5 TaxID=2962573 RepID=UPI002881D8AD|nr:hypothetical protein [Nocardioides sp. AE5]MDT0202877.1 hypothetical protein [Nocardioides sp. AE5]
MSCSKATMVAVAVGVLFVISGCSGSGENTPAGAPSAPSETLSSVGSESDLPSVDGEIVRGEAHADYDVAASVVGAAEPATVVVIGRVKSWAEGRIIHDGDSALKSAVLEVEVETSLVPRTVESAFVEIDRGGTLIDEEGNEVELHDGATYVQRSVEELRQAVPVGTRVVVLGVAAPTDEEIASTGGQQVIEAWVPPHGDDQLVSPVQQGLLFEDADGSYVSGVADQEDVEFGDWPAAGERGDAGGSDGYFDQLVDELTAAF